MLGGTAALDWRLKSNVCSCKILRIITLKEIVPGY